MPASPLVSVIIPSYNHDRFLQEAIDSVLTQTDIALELIIVDDGSRDDSWALIERASANDPRVRAFAQTNQGAHAAINAGLRAARGDYIAILNSDDRFHPGRLSQLVALAREGYDFIATGLRLIDQSSQPIPDAPWLDEYRRMRQAASQRGTWEALLERNFTVSTSNFFFSRALLQAIGPIRPLRYNMDWDWAIRAYLHAPDRFVWRDDLTLWDYRIHGANTILGGLPRSAIEANHVLYRALSKRYAVPAPALAGLRRHYKLIRQQQCHVVARERDASWEAKLQEAHAGWAATRDAHDEAHARLGQTLTELGETRTTLAQTQNTLAQTRFELEAIRNSRSYRLGMTLTKPLRWWKDRQRPAAATPSPTTAAAAPAAAPIVHGPPAPRYRTLSLNRPAAAPAAPRVAVHIHLHYADLLDEMLDAVAHLPGEFDLFITTNDDAQALRDATHARFPAAHVWQCPNLGKDIGPFIDALQRYRLHEYELVLKLHGKKSRNQPSYMNAVRGLFGKDIQDGDDWRRKLVAPISGSTARVQAIYDAFEADPQLGMVGAARFICRAPDADASAYQALCARLGISEEILFFGGTMFWLRGAVLKPLIDEGFTQNDFDAAHQASVESSLEHQMERVFGGLTALARMDVGGVADLSAR
ncbi:glycosyltransferase [Pseudomonadota bacterium AL_CKDN230030165-1A_HGKHYDSX7]